MTLKRTNHGRGHSYKDDGRKIPGVTTYLNAFPKPALVTWAAGSVGEFVADHLQMRNGTLTADELLDDLAEISAGRGHPLPDKFSRVKVAEALKYLPYAERDAAANRGTEVHTLAQKLAEGQEVDVPEPIAGHVDSYLKFRDEWMPENELVERPVLSRKHFYAGTFDIVADIPTLGRVMVDIKTSRSGIFGETGLQLAAYRYAEVYLDEDGVEQPMPELDGCYGLWIRGDGYDLYPMQAGDAEYRLFRYVQQIAVFMEGPKLFGEDGDSEMWKIRGEALTAPEREDVPA